MGPAAALLPVLLFLATLFLLDTFKLVPLRSVMASLAAGAAVALATLWFHDAVLAGLDPVLVSRYAAPLVEEIGKASVVLMLIAAGRVGFVADAGVKGFAVGAGFAVVENITYLAALSDAPAILWAVRGLGTAVLHGATTAIFGMIAKALSDRPRSAAAAAYLPGLAAAVAIHSAFNHVLLPPVVQTLVLLMVLPLVVLWVFDRSDRATREWIGAGLDLDLEVLQLVRSDSFTETRLGRHLLGLRSRFPGPTVANMYCLLRLELELAVQAKALVMARSAGLDLPADEDLEAALAERRYLQRSVGRSGVRALEPLRVTSRRDEWHRRLLQQARSEYSPAASAFRRKRDR
jgi:RsiW-degrading membrane proteinase PrsW (M82 family)